MSIDRAPQSQPEEREQTSSETTTGDASAPRTQFSASGALPPVAPLGGGKGAAQLSASERAFGSEHETHAVAARGVRGGGGPMPHADRIAKSFGPAHASTVMGIQAHTGGAATRANDQLGAQAYAHGNHVAFAGAPDLHTAAEEAAHVVQQRQGVQLAGGVGEAGDAHEQQADVVADRVVAGRSAEDVLPQAAGGAPGEAVQFKPKDLPEGDEGFQEMWDAHPHNYQSDEAQNTASPDVLDEHGLPQEFENTCAIRLSIMLNGIGETITPAKAKAAGVARKPHYSKKTKQYYILSAGEMWKYLAGSFRKPDKVVPAQGRFKSTDEFDTAFEQTIKPAVAGKHGIVAFDKIFGYGGTGHVDLFDGEQLSDSSSWYQSQSVQLWYI